MSRLRPETDTDAVVSHVKGIFPAYDMVKADKLETKLNMYASYRVELYVKRSHSNVLLTSAAGHPVFWFEGSSVLTVEAEIIVILLLYVVCKSVHITVVH
jgi:hypothetical protein